LITFQKICSLYNIDKKDQDLPTYVDDELNVHPQNLIADQKAIKTASVTINTKTNKKRVDIITVKPPPTSAFKLN
jgi:DUF4097 and DUF4098 domain-containing protein YvlB